VSKPGRTPKRGAKARSGVGDAKRQPAGPLNQTWTQEIRRLDSSIRIRSRRAVLTQRKRNWAHNLTDHGHRPPSRSQSDVVRYGSGVGPDTDGRLAEPRTPARHITGSSSRELAPPQSRASRSHTYAPCGLYSILVDWGGLPICSGVPWMCPPHTYMTHSPEVITWAHGMKLEPPEPPRAAVMAPRNYLYQCFEQLLPGGPGPGCCRGGRGRSAAVTMSATYPSPSVLSSELLPRSNARD
jgi:hypothetical protein